MDSIFNRVSVRKYQDKLVEPEKVEQILRAGMQAPSAYNLQPWEFFVIENADIKAKLAVSNNVLQAAKNSPLLILTAYREATKVPEYNQISLSACMENMWLEATSLGLGAVWLGIAPFTEHMQKVDEIVNLPAGLKSFALLSVGYPLSDKKVSDRFDQTRIHYVK